VGQFKVMKMTVSITQMQVKHHHTTGCPIYEEVMMTKTSLFKVIILNNIDGHHYDDNFKTH
jgi:hypothetical protein